MLSSPQCLMVTNHHLSQIFSAFKHKQTQRPSTSAAFTRVHQATWMLLQHYPAATGRQQAQSTGARHLVPQYAASPRCSLLLCSTRDEFMLLHPSHAILLCTTRVPLSRAGIADAKTADHHTSKQRPQAPVHVLTNTRTVMAFCCVHQTTAMLVRCLKFKSRYHCCCQLAAELPALSH